MFRPTIKLTVKHLADILAYEHKDQAPPVGDLSADDIDTIVKGHYYGLSDDVTCDWAKDLDPDQKKTLHRWALRWAKKYAIYDWEKVADDHYVSTRGETTLVLTTIHSNKGEWSLLIRTTGKRERAIQLATKDPGTAKELADIYSR